MPHSVELEKCILASALQDENALFDVMSDMKDDYFYDARNRIIFTALKKLEEDHKPLDHVLLVEELKEMGKYEQAGAEAYLSEILTSAATDSNVKEYCSAVKDKWTLRTLIRTSTQISDACYETGADAAACLGGAEQKIFDIAKGENEKNAPVLLKNVMSKIYNDIKTRTMSDGVTGLRTGFQKLDECTTGFHEGELIVVGGRPGMGKTALGLSMALEMGKIEKIKPIIIFSLEMPTDQVIHRFLSIESRVNLQSIRGGLHGEDLNKVFSGGARIANLPIFINDSAVGVSDVNSRCRRIAKEYGGLGCVIIDYLQLMLPKDSRNYNREQEVSLISRSLKYLAKELHVPIIALAQVNREVEKHKSMRKDAQDGGTRPNLSDLRESGAIEQDADAVLFVHRPSYYFEKKNEKDMNGEDADKFRKMKNKAEIIIAKQRNGPTTSVPISFNHEYAQFCEPQNEDGLEEERGETW